MAGVRAALGVLRADREGESRRQLWDNVRRMRTGLPVKFEPAEGGVRIEGVVVDCDPATGRATSCEALRVEVD